MDPLDPTSYSNFGFDADTDIAASELPLPQPPPAKAIHYDSKKLDIPDEDSQEERGTWTNPCDFFLSALGYAVGLGNVWRFPYLAYKNGGGSFLIPYTIMLLFAGLPLFFLELALGQYSGCGPTRLFGRMSPIFKGLGFGMIGATFYVAIYYNMIIAWSIFYMFAGFQAELPWIHCPNNITDIVNKCYEPNVTQLAPGIHLNSTWSPSEEYFNTIMLGLDQQANNWGNFGTVRWQLVLCLLAAWVIVCLCLIKGVQSSGKVVYFTALFPFFVLFILFVVGLTLPGSGAGIMFYITPDFEKLKTVDVWTSAANQIFYSLGPAFGGLITLSSYNKFNNNCHRDAILIAFSNCATSVFAGFVVFSILGFMAHTQDVPVADVVKDGTGLAFVAFPDAFSRMSFCPQLWAFLFFFMLLTLGLDSMFATVETMTTAILDHFRSLRPFKEWVVASTCAFCFICGLSMCSQGGIYMFKLLDDRSASWNILLFALLEVILVAWVYGVDLFFENLKEMEIPMPWVMKWYWKICWKFISPTILTVLIIMGLAQSGPVKYSNYEFETPVQALGWMLGVSTVIFIPLVGAWNVYKRYRAHKPVGWALLKPTPKWKPANGQPTGTSMDKLDEA